MRFTLLVVVSMMLAPPRAVAQSLEETLNFIFPPSSNGLVSKPSIKGCVVQQNIGGSLYQWERQHRYADILVVGRRPRYQCRQVFPDKLLSRATWRFLSGQLIRKS